MNAIFGKDSNIYAVAGIVVAVVFGLMAILHAPTSAFGIVALVMAACYAVFAVLNKGGHRRPEGRPRNRGAGRGGPGGRQRDRARYRDDA